MDVWDGLERRQGDRVAPPSGDRAVRILFAGKQHFEIGGVETSTDQLARRLLVGGHQVTVLASPPEGTASGFDRLELVPGYPYEAYAAHGMPPAEALAAVRRSFRPDVVIVNAGGKWWHDWTRPLVAAAGEIPCVLYVCDREAVELLELGQVAPDAVWTVADSHTAAARAVCSLPVKTVPSLVEPELYRTEPSGEVVLYVNPVKSKGVRTAITLAAARRDIPFVFLRSWAWKDEKFADLSRMAAALGNIEVAASTPDPREQYRRARVLLAPYDDFGRPRVVAETQLSGIPSLALDEAGNREAVGPGGIVVPRDAPIAQWTAALADLWDDPEEHRRLSAAALAHSARPEMDPDGIVTLVETELARTIERFHSHATDRQRPTAAVSVVLPVHNGAHTIGEQLEALARQSYTGPWELVVSDNGSTDGTRGRVIAWRGGMPGEIRIVDASGHQSVAHARNIGILNARGSRILICDADDVVSSTWMEQMLAALDEHTIVTGWNDRRRLNRPEQHEWMGLSDVERERMYGHLVHASGGNLGVRREVALAVGAFDESLLRAEDIDWSWRAQYAGYDIWFEPSAVIHVRMTADLRALARTSFRAGVAEAGLYRLHRRHGMPADQREDVVEAWRSIVRGARLAWREPERRYRWTATAARRGGRLAGSLRHRVAFL